MFHFDNSYEKTWRKIFGVLFLLLSLWLFFGVLATEIFISTKVDSQDALRLPQLPIYVRFFVREKLVSSLRIAIGPAIHSLYVTFFVWGISLLGTSRAFSTLQRVSGLIVQVLMFSVSYQAYTFLQKHNYSEMGIIGANFIIYLLIQNFGVRPTIVATFVMGVVGFMIAMDWFTVWLLISVARVAKSFYAGVYLCVLYAKRWYYWLADNVLSLEGYEEYTISTAPPSVQLHLPLRMTEPKETSPILPDIPEPKSVDTNKDVPLNDTPKKVKSPQDVQQQDGGSVLKSPPPKNERQTHLILSPSSGSMEPMAPVRSSKSSREGKQIPLQVPSSIQYPKEYTKPPLTLLDEPVPINIPDYEEELRHRAEVLLETLSHFNVRARVTGITHGPTVTRFELEPEPGISVTQFIARADDLALALKAERVRVEAPIPGKGKIGIEVPNPVRQQVLLRELLESHSFIHHRGKLKLPLGKDIGCEVKVADLTLMPHLLIAGATGSGKTVFVKALLASLLFQYTPEELKFILIDPKMVEFSIFNDIPHLIEPVVTDAKMAGEALEVLIKEMEYRYRLFAQTGCRNIEVFNQNVENGTLRLDDLDLDLFEQERVKNLQKLPYIVCIIDELADLMMLQRSAVEGAIARLSQLARAVGIHLIVATQRPSVDVITGVIKANFPARISFRVSSRVDSRCILDTMGAEKLIGHGDMLYHNAGTPKPIRIQGAFVSDEEIESLVDYLKKQAPPQYRNNLNSSSDRKEDDEWEGGDDDPLYPEAVRIVLECKQASVSLLQRRLRIGYARAGHLIDLMERRGIVGPHRGSKPREILVDINDNNLINLNSMGLVPNEGEEDGDVSNLTTDGMDNINYNNEIDGYTENEDDDTDDPDGISGVKVRK